MASLQDVINRTLVALGHADDLIADGATELTDNYHIKIAQYVNDILEEVEAAAQWRSLRQRDTATISANALSGSLSLSNERSRVFLVQDQNHGMLVPLVFDVTDTENQTRLFEMELSELLRRDQENSNNSEGDSPSYFALSPTASGMDIYVWPRPTADVNIEADMIIPQSRMGTESQVLLETTVKVPSLPVVLGSTWWAMEDRGEELGVNSEGAKARYDNALSSSVALEMDSQGFNDLVAV